MEQNTASKHSNLNPLSWFSVFISIAEKPAQLQICVGGKQQLFTST